MSHLLAIAVGPVQEFIAAARRTRDLWFGSYLLSEFSRAVARSVEADGGKLIFPATSDAENVANVILAELLTGDPKVLAAKARQAAQKRWLEFAGEAHREAFGVIRQDIWSDQVEDVIEFYAAWVPHPDSNKYADDRKKLMRLLAGRKNCRDFLPAKGRAGVPKSSLDGQRESVLREGDRSTWPQRLRLSTGEQLDVVGVVKRLGEGRKSYASVTRIAADPWVRGLTDDVRKELSASAAKIKNLQRVEQETLKAFPYEGHVLYLNRHADLAKEAKLQPDELQPIKEILTKLMEPNPYLAVLVADGDKMGAAISKLEKAQNHREFSRALAGFASLAKQIVEQHHGVLVYAGGDDVLAFLPVDKCLCCARALRNKFIECLKTQVPNDTPTLSVGIAIGHFMENLEDLLEYGHEAEKAAKNVEGKDALAVHLHKRGGAPIKIAGKWGALDLQLDRYTQLFIDEALPAKFPYELRQLANVYDGWKDAVEVIQADVRRIIKKKRSKEGDTKQLQENLLTLIAQLTNSAAIRQVSEVLLVAKQIEENYTQANRRQVNDQ